MVDHERLARILTRVRDDVADLRTSGAAGAGLAEDQVGLRAVKYSFVTAIEGCVRAANHVLSSEGFGTADSNASAMRSLGQHGALDPALADRLAQAVGFRNVLVHEYAQVDDARVIANLSLLDDLDEFVRQLSSWASGR